jgi:sarcosine oxidase subunit gamma
MLRFLIRKGSACVVDHERIDDRSIVSLKVVRTKLDAAREELRLAPELRVSGDDPRCLWFGPDRWLLVSDTMTPEAIIDSCDQALDGMLHNAVDYSAGLVVMRLAGSDARQVLATGTGVDLRSNSFPVDTCCRIRLAEIAVVLVADSPDSYELYVDRSYEDYLSNWIKESSSAYASYRGT